MYSIATWKFRKKKSCLSRRRVRWLRTTYTNSESGQKNRNQMHPKYSLGALKATWQRNAVFLTGSFAPVHFTPGLWSRALLTREFAGGSRIPLRKRFSNGLELQTRQPWGLMGRRLGLPLIVHSAHITNTSRIKGCCACTSVAPHPRPPNLIMLPSWLDCLLGLGCFRFDLNCGTKADFQTGFSWKLLYILF